MNHLFTIIQFFCSRTIASNYYYPAIAFYKIRHVLNYLYIIEIPTFNFPRVLAQKML